MIPFIFATDSLPSAAHVANVPAGIRREKVLIDALAVALRFPSYFGRNWDALDECICDLEWLPEGDVLVRHADVPFAEDARLLGIYLTVLRRAIEEWRSSGARALFVVFPPESESAVRGATLST